jgi:hypothetical protein
MDPLKVDDYSYPGVFEVKVFGTWLYGISSFYRLGEMSIDIRNNSMVVGEYLWLQVIDHLIKQKSSCFSHGNGNSRNSGTYYVAGFNR